MAPGSGLGLAALAARLDDLVAVAGGNGLVAATVSDELVAAGGHLIEGASAPGSPEPFQGLGLCRLFVGLRHTRSNVRAFVEAHGFDDEASLWSSLERLRAGDAQRPVGFVVSPCAPFPLGPTPVNAVWRHQVRATSWRWKNSIWSPTWMSLNPSSPRPHS